MKKCIAAIIVLLFITLGFSYYLQTTDNVVIVNVGELASNNPAQFSIIDNINITDAIELRWTSDEISKEYGDVAYVCLQAIDSQGKAIKFEGKSSNCSYGAYNEYNDISVSTIIGTTTVSEGIYKLKIDPVIASFFQEKPSAYELSIFVIDSLPSEGRSEWAGLISSKYSNRFKINF